MRRTVTVYFDPGDEPLLVEYDSDTFPRARSEVEAMPARTGNFLTDLGDEFRALTAALALTIADRDLTDDEGEFSTARRRRSTRSSRETLCGRSGAQSRTTIRQSRTIISRARLPLRGGGRELRLPIVYVRTHSFTSR